MVKIAIYIRIRKEDALVIECQKQYFNELIKSKNNCEIVEFYIDVTEERMSSFEKHSFRFMDVCVCVYVCVPHECGYPKGPRQGAKFPELESPVAVGCLTWVLGTEL